MTLKNGIGGKKRVHLKTKAGASDFGILCFHSDLISGVLHKPSFMIQVKNCDFI